MKTVFLVALTLVVLTLTGCGSGSGHHSDPLVYNTQILSDYSFDGDIARSPGGVTFTITQDAAESYYAGFDPADGAELRTFLQFSLPSVLSGAFIQSASLDLFINSIQPNPLLTTIPIRIDLVDISRTWLLAGDFDRALQPALATTTIYPPIAQADFGQHVLVDVTELLIRAQVLGLTKFQARILVDPGAPAAGLIEINDTTGVNRATLAPLLDVSYY